ncbi:MAG TPA: HAMP domain-containing sensor histidine kinase [Gemmatimonadaceae bacterium]|nr:HAMP domain-containing sensor histidine kinase [Gemmatimonadaceae bacterium]
MGPQVIDPAPSRVADARAARAPARAPALAPWHRRAWSSASALLPLWILVLALLASVAIPARQTWLITNLLRQTTEVVEPARRLGASIQAGLGEENEILRRYATSGDATLRGTYLLRAQETDRDLASLLRLAPGLDSVAIARVHALEWRVHAWRADAAEITAPPADGNVRYELAAAQARQSGYEACLRALSELSGALAAASMDDAIDIRDREQMSLVSNALLVLGALGALRGVLLLTRRVRRQARREAALREAAEVLAGAFTSADVSQRIAELALETMGGSGAFVEQMVPPEDGEPASVVVQAVAGTGMPDPGTVSAYRGSYTERVAAHGASLQSSTREIHRPVEVSDAAERSHGRAITVPLSGSPDRMGALYVAAREGTSFSPIDVAQAGVFGHIAALAYEKVRLFDAAHARGRELEQVLQSRSRLMRGFSHDVKNPLGAADGYAELLTEGVYGELSRDQRESVTRLRDCIRGALALIDDLHELARVEAGAFAVARAPVDLELLVERLGEEYGAAARASGLSLETILETGPFVVVTSDVRVRQIVSNLLSNAIKYTDAGGVTLRLGRRADRRSDDERPWVAIAVSDTGPGIPTDKLDLLFQEFSRLNEDGKRGAGLGLAISRLLAQALGGYVSVESELGRGSTFTLWLPVGEGDDASPGATRIVAAARWIE